MSMKTKKSAAKAAPKTGGAGKQAAAMMAKPVKKPARRGK